MTLNQVIDKWNAQQPFLLVTSHGVRNIYVRPHCPQGWQRFIAVDSELNADDGPFGFGITEKAALHDLIRNSYYQRLIEKPPSLPRVADLKPEKPQP